jgi:hypothetical protein
MGVFTLCAWKRGPWGAERLGVGDGGCTEGTDVRGNLSVVRPIMQWRMGAGEGAARLALQEGAEWVMSAWHSMPRPSTWVQAAHGAGDGTRATCMLPLRLVLACQSRPGKQSCAGQATR